MGIHFPFYNRLRKIFGNPLFMIAVILTIVSFHNTPSSQAAQGDFSPDRDGITKKDHPYGLSYNDFNNFLDNAALCYMRGWWPGSKKDPDIENCNVDYQDERDFLTAKNYSSSSDKYYYHTLNGLKPGDTVRVMFYYHNNAEETVNNKYTAKDVTAYIDFSNPNEIEGRLYCQNCEHENIYDIASLQSTDDIELEYVPNSIQLIQEDELIQFKDSDSRLSIDKTQIVYRDGNVPGCSPYQRFLHIDFKVKEKAPPAECSSLLLSPATIDIADILDQSGKEQMAITTNPSKFEGPYDWTASSGGKLTDSCSWTSFVTNTTDEKMTFCGDNVGEKVSVKNRAFTSCTDSTTITDYCGNGYAYTAGGEECDNGTANTDTPCTPSYGSECSYCKKNCDKVTVKGGYCGDKKVDTGYEKCDDGNTSNSDTCTTSCTLTYCGDKTVQNPNGNGQKEECDDGNTTNNDGCSSTCIKEIPPAECSSLLLSPATIDIADILDQSGKEQMSITTNPSKFEGPYDWTASSGGKLTDSCSWTSFVTNTTDEKMTFCGDNVGEKVSVKNRAFTACTDSTTITDYCGNGYTYSAGGEECDNGTANTDTPCTPSYGSECSYCKKNCDKVTVKGGYCGDKKVDTGYEKCDDGNTSNSDTCTTSCTFTYCGDKTVQNPNGNGQKEECDDGNTTNNDGCSSTCIKEIPPAECDSLQFLNTEIIANTQTTLSINVEPDSYVPDIKWTATETGTFNDKNPYNSGSTTSVTFKNGSIDEYILTYDTDFPTACNDTLQVIGCKNLTTTPSKFDLTPGKAQLITITPNPTSWNKSFKWTSTDTSATFNGQTSGYTSTDYTVDYIGNTNADITITDIYGNCKASAMATAIFCGNGIKETGEECDDGNTVDTDSCKNNCTIPTSEPIACTGLTSNPTSLSAGQASDISIAPQPENFTGTFIWTASRGLLQNLSNPTSTPASTINTDENDMVHYDGNSVSGDTVSIREQSNQCNAAMPITGPSGENPFCGNGIIETGETCEPPNTATCDAKCQIPGDGKPPGGGTPCEINILNKEGDELYDKYNVPTPVNIFEFPFYFQIEEISSGKPYNLKTINNSEEYVGTFTSYSGTDWDSADVYRPNENPMDESYQTSYSFSMDKSQIDSDTRLSVNSQFDSCSAQLRFSVGGPSGEGNPETACTSMKTSIDTLNFGIMNIENQLPIIVELMTDPQDFSDTFTWTVSPSNLPITFNGANPPHPTGDKTVAIDLAEGKTIADVTQGTISIKSTSAETECFANIYVKPAVSEGLGIDALVKKSFCLDPGTTIGQDLDPATYNMFYYFNPEGLDATVIFHDTFGDDGKIPGEINGTPAVSDHIKYTGMQKPTLNGSVEIPICTPGYFLLCYEGDLGQNSELTLKNLQDSSIDPHNDYIQLTFGGTIHADSDLKCDDAESSLELFRNKLTSEARDASNAVTSRHDSYASIWASCPYLLTRNMGDTFFEEPFDWGADTTAVSNVKNSTGLVFKQYESEPAASCQTGGTNIIQRFSSYLCEFSTFIAELWGKDPIANRIGEKIEKITRYFEKSESAGTTETINSLTINTLDNSHIFSEKPDTTQKIYEYRGDLTIEGIGGGEMSIDGNEARTLLVYGNLIIKSNITYTPMTSTETWYKNIPSIAFVVKKDTSRMDSTGNIRIAPNVTYIAGVWYAQNALESSGGNSADMLEIQGSVYGDIEPLFRTRKKVGNPEKDEGSIVIRYDERIILNTPPGLKDVLESNWEEVAR